MNTLIQVSLKWIQIFVSQLCLLPPTLIFSFLKWFLQASNNNKRQLDWQLKYLQFDRKVTHTLNLIYIIKFDNCSGNIWAEGFYRPETPFEKMREIDNEARISKKAEMKRKFNRTQKQITLWDIQISSLIFWIYSRSARIWWP